MIGVGSTLPPPPLWGGWGLGSVSLAQLVCKAVSRSYVARILVIHVESTLPPPWDGWGVIEVSCR